MTDKERLEEIKEWFNANEEIHEFQIEWLIKQAEKLERNEKRYWEMAKKLHVCRKKIREIRYVVS